MTAHRWLPVALVVAAGAYLVFALGLETRTMPGDPGYDPGMRAVPLAAGALLLLLALALLVRDTLLARPAAGLAGDGGDEEALPDRAVLAVALLHLAAGLAFLLLLRPLGFLLVAAFLLAILLLACRRLAGVRVASILWIVLPVAAAGTSVVVTSGLEALAGPLRAMAEVTPWPGAAGRHGLAAASLVLLACGVAGGALAARRLAPGLPVVLFLLPAALPPAIILVFNRLFLNRIPAYPPFLPGSW